MVLWWRSNNESYSAQSSERRSVGGWCPTTGVSGGYRDEDVAVSVDDDSVFGTRICGYDARYWWAGGP